MARPALLPRRPQVLEAQGQSAVSPAQRQGLHPLAIPLAQQPGGELTCLLRWPEGHKGMELPVVSQARDGTQVCEGRGEDAMQACPVLVLTASPL